MNRKDGFQKWIVWFVMLAVVTSYLIASPTRAQCQPPKRKSARTPAPVLKSDDFSDIFFQDVRTHLQGPSPIISRQQGQVMTGMPRNVDRSPSNAPLSLSPPTTGNGQEWKGNLRQQTMEELVKEAKLRLDRKLTTPVLFFSGGGKDTRRDLRLLAILFAMIEEEPRGMRWQASAPVLRSRFSQIAHDAQAGSLGVFNEAKMSLAELGDLLSGTKVLDTGNVGALEWSKVSDRVQTMQLLEWVYRDTIVKLAANPLLGASEADEFQKYVELIAALSTTLKMKGMDDASDQGYIQHVDRLLESTSNLSHANQMGDKNAIRMALGRIENACNQCHDSYR